MKRNSEKLLKIICVNILITFIFISCASLPEKRYATEEDRLYNEAVFYLEHGNGFNDYYQKAYKLFEELIEKYPGSRYLVEAKIGKADALFKQGKYSLAATIYDEIVSSYSYHPLSVKAKYMIAECFRKLSDSFDRDLQNIKMAYDHYDGFISLCNTQKSLNPEFCREKLSEAEKYRAEMEDKLAKRILYIAEFYLRRGYRLAAYERLQELIKKYPESHITKKAKKVYERLRKELWSEN